MTNIAAMQLQLLGPVSVVIDGDVVESTRPMEASVLAALALNANRGVSRERLVDLLWGESPPASATKSLQSHVMRVRRMLEAAGASDQIETVEGGYRLRIRPGAIDVTVFEEAVVAGRAAIDRGEVEASLSILGDALAMWRGVPLSPAAAPGLEPHRVRLDELRNQAFELWAEAKLAAGEHDALVGDLRDAVNADPYRERLWAILMLALYRSGRQADALIEYQRISNILIEELGVTPGHELRDLEMQILNQDVQLAAPQATDPVLPPVLESEAARLFVGRTQEVAAAEAAIETTRSGRRSIVLVSGEAGIGKSVFTSQIAVLAASAGFGILYGRCDEHLAAPYQPFVQMLRAGMIDVPTDLQRSVLAKLLPELVTEEDAPVEADPETERLRLFDAVAAWLRSLATSQPVVLVLEDLHWADAPTLQLLRHVVRELVASPVMIVANFRPHGVEDKQGLDALLVEASRQSELTEIALAGLSQNEIATYLDQSGAARANDLSAGLLAVSNGNPLFVSELADHLQSGGSLPTQGSDVPTGIRRTVEARLRGLDDEAIAVLELAALVGHVFRFDVLRMAFAETDVDGPLLQAVAAGLVIDLPGRDLEYRFTHALTRLAISARLSETARSRHHQRIGNALEALPTATAVDIARHFRASVGLGEHERAVTHTLVAAKEALAQYGDATAAELFQAAIDLEPGPADLAESLIGLGEAQRRLGRPHYRDTLIGAYESAAVRSDGEQMARALLASYRGTFSRALRVDRKMVDRLASAAELLAGDSALRARVLASQAVELAWDLDWRFAKSLSDEALAMARRLDDDATLGRVLALRHWTVYDSLEDRLETTAELDAVLVRLPDPALQFEAAGMAAFTLTRVGDHLGADRRMREAAQLADTLDRPPERWMLLIRQYAAAMRDGRYGDAENYCAEGLELGQATGQPDALTQFGVQSFWQACDRQPQDDGVAMLHVLLKDFERAWPLGWPSYAFRCSELGLAAEARQIIDAFEALGLIDELPRDQMWAYNLSMLAATASFLRDERLAARLLPQLEPVSGQHANSVFVSIGAVDRYLSLAARSVGDLDRALRWCEAAIESNRALPAWRARTLLDLAELRILMQLGDSEAPVSEAAHIASSLELPLIAARANRLST